MGLSEQDEIENYRRIFQIFKDLFLVKGLDGALQLTISFLKAHLRIEKGVFFTKKGSSDIVMITPFGGASKSLNQASSTWVKMEEAFPSIGLNQIIPIQASGKKIGYLCFDAVPSWGEKEKKCFDLFLHTVSGALYSKSFRDEFVRQAVQKSIAAEMSSLKDVNFQLQEALKAKSKFFSQMNHEIRTPLNSVIGISDLMIDEMEEMENVPSSCVEKLEVISHSGQSLLMLINDVLDISKIEANEIKLENQIFDLHELISDLMHMFQGRVQDKNVSLLSDVSSKIGLHCSGDPTRLKQVLVNLIGNSLKFTKEGYIKVSVKKEEGDWLLFSVEDTGPGILDEKKDIVFSEFRQADESVARKYGGSGLGLNISQQIIELMGGSIWVEDNPNQKGSLFCFRVRLPDLEVKDVQAEILERKRRRIQEKIQNLPEGLVVLVADDSPENRFLLKALFAKSKCLLKFAENGKEALEVYEKDKPDLVLMDIQMPQLDGMAATNRIRELELQNKIDPSIIVALTANEDAKQKYIDAGFNGKLTKPIVKKVLFEEIQAILGDAKKINDTRN